jgi:hypothetical protein
MPLSARERADDSAGAEPATARLGQACLVLRSRKVSRERARLLHGVQRFNVFTSKSQVAASLWDYGEDDLADRALLMSDEDLEGIERIAAHFESPTYDLPMDGQRITHNHVNAFAAIMFFEGALRPLSRTRRRPSKLRPVRFTPHPPDPGRGI